MVMNESVRLHLVFYFYIFYNIGQLSTCLIEVF